MLHYWHDFNDNHSYGSYCFFCFFNEVFTTIPSIAGYFHHPYSPQPSSTGAECEGEKEEEGPCEGLSGPAGQ